MTITEAIEILEQHNAWRRNRDEVNFIPPLEPSEIGESIDLAVEYLKAAIRTQKILMDENFVTLV